MCRGNEDGIRFFCVFVWALKRALYRVKKGDVAKELLELSKMVRKRVIGLIKDLQQ